MIVISVKMLARRVVVPVNQISMIFYVRTLTRNS
jgi:hypothetical protein